MYSSDGIFKEHENKIYKLKDDTGKITQHTLNNQRIWIDYRKEEYSLVLSQIPHDYYLQIIEKTYFILPSISSDSLSNTDTFMVIIKCDNIIIEAYIESPLDIIDPIIIGAISTLLSTLN
jgi:hypothetical protein